ncbi:MAG: hypothetical protein WBN32_05350 [Woeseia sp.]
MSFIHVANRLRQQIPLALLCLCAIPGTVFAATADELFEDGNRLNRDDLYWAALLRYEQAAEAGLDSPLLHYNSGVAHYRARQYGRARQAFLQAQTDAGLFHAADYNLGLTAFALGDSATALRLFRRVEQQQESPRLSALATRAITDLLENDATAVAQTQSAFDDFFALRPEGLQLRISSGVGNDDNAFRTPDQSYNDRAQVGNPLITPVISSGTYVPVDFNARYSVGSFENESFFGSYRVMTRYYLDPKLEDAGELTQQLAFGSTFHSKSENRERKVNSAFTVAQHNEVWFDPDDGTERRDNGELLGERLSYVRYGPELWARQSFKRLTFSVHGKGQIWNYEKAGDAQEYDHEFLQGGLSVQYRFTTTSLLRIEGEISQRRFGDRRAYDRDGTQSSTNPSLRYDYRSLGATARQRLTRSFWFGLRYLRSDRTDRYLGYNDYLRDSYGGEFSLRVNNRLKVRAEGWYRIYNYVRAYAYQTPAAGRKTMETADARVTARWQFNDDVSLIGSFEYADTASNDLRIDYTRSQYMIGLRWQF